MEDDNYVYHGSPVRSFEIVVPKNNRRVLISRKTGAQEVVFDDISFHASPNKWIGIAYTYQSKPYEINGKKAHYNMGVNLYENEKTLTIYGFDSLKKSLKKLYGTGGYLYTFDKKDFFHMTGLGDLEVITKKQVKPITIERVDDPVRKLRELGVEFKFIDLALSENERDKNYEFYPS